MTKLVQFFTGAPETVAEAEPDPERIFVREVAEYSGTGRLMRQQMERLAELPYKPGDPPYRLTNTTEAVARAAVAAARLLSAQAASARALAMLREPRPRHLIVEHRDGRAPIIPARDER